MHGMLLVGLMSVESINALFSDLFERLLDRTTHVKVWRSYADFELKHGDQSFEKAKEVSCLSTTSDRLRYILKGPRTGYRRGQEGRGF